MRNIVGLRDAVRDAYSAAARRRRRVVRASGEGHRRKAVYGAGIPSGFRERE
jgi:hypothetical protein